MIACYKVGKIPSEFEKDNEYFSKATRQLEEQQQKSLCSLVFTVN